MKDDFSWLDDERPLERAPDSSGVRRGLRRFLPRLPGLPRLRRRSRPRVDAASAPDSAAAMLEARDNRPVEELDDRLRSLRERSFGGQPPGASGSAALFDVDEVLVTPEFQRKPGGVISAVALSKAQEQQVELLKDIVGGSLDASDEDDGGRRRLDLAPRFSLSALIRLALSALLMTVVALPFVSSDYAIGDLTAPEDRPALTSMYDLLDDLAQDEYVLVGLEYGPTAAGELDALADLLLRHIVAKSAKPLIVSSNPIALIHAQNIIRKINRSVAAAGLSLEANQDYYLLRYLPGGALGLRELSENFADVARVSAKGELTGLEVSALEDMSLILLVAESAEDLRLWVEQVLPETEDARLLAATGYAAAPLAAAYADSLEEIVGLVVGFRDAYLYSEKLAAAYGAPRGAQRESAVEAAPAEDSPDPQDAAPLPTVKAQATSAPTATAPPTLTPSPTLPPPTATPPPTETPLPTATSEPVLYVEVTANQLINIRREPTTAADILAVAGRGDRFEALGTNVDGSWYNILLPDGLEAWIAEFLVEELLIAPGDEVDSASAPREQTLMRLEFPLRLGKNQPRFYQAQAPGNGDQSAYIVNRDRRGETSRLQAMTLGALGSVLIIVFGNLVSALRAFGLRRAGPAS